MLSEGYEKTWPDGRRVVGRFTTSADGRVVPVGRWVWHGAGGSVVEERAEDGE
jgi:hypothetical protein